MSSPPTDPYKILGVSKDAQIPEIRSAHRKLVLKCHPDKVQDPALKAQKQDEFQKVQQAYEILSDENQRQKYDELASKQARLAELRRYAQSKANSSSPRSGTTFKYEIHTTERPSSYKSGTSPGARVYTSYSRSYDEELGRSPPFEPERTVRREASYPDKSSKREMERERDRDREKERERRRKEEASRRAEKEAKDARRAEKKAREREREKERRRETEEKRRHAKPSYIEEYDTQDEPIPVISRTTEKKKSSSSRKHEKRDRSSHREEALPPTDIQEGVQEKENFATSYIYHTRAKRPTARHMHMQMPAVPTPPPAQSSPFPVPAADDDVHRSAAKPRRGSSGEKSYRTASRESLDADVVSVSPGRTYRKSASAMPSMPAMSGSPPHLPRTHSMPIPPDFTRPMPIRAQTFAGGVSYSSAPRGRGRSNLQPQIEESGSEDDYEQRPRERRRRGSKKNHSPERVDENVIHYDIHEGRTRVATAYSRQLPTENYDYYGSNPYSSHRPSMPVHDSGYGSTPPTARFSRFKTSKNYDLADVSISEHFNQEPSYRDSYAYGVA